MHDHSHGAAVRLEAEAAAILERGLSELLALTEGLEFKPLVSERHPLPVSAAVSGEEPDPEAVRAEVEKRLNDDPVAALESALVLLELLQANELTAAEAVPDDGAFLSEAFRSKRCNGWMAVLGGADPAGVEEAVNTRWQFKLVAGPGRLGGLYVLLNMLCRYGFVYGRVQPGDSHAMGHFIEEFTPGVLVCRGEMTDLELTLSLAAMKLGVPAVVAPDYPFPLGRRALADSLDDVVECATAFPNVRKLLDLPGLPKLPDYLEAQNAGEEFEPVAVYGNTDESFYVFRKGEVPEPGSVTVSGEPGPAMGIVLTAEAEPLDAVDRQYIESRAARTVNMLRGVNARVTEGRLVVQIAPEYELDPVRLGETLVAAVRHEFPKIERVSAEIVFDRERLAADSGGVRAEHAARRAEIDAQSEESVGEFMTCVGCSPFAPDHVCVLTPERHPQCARPYAMIKTGALYGYDDMSNIHHRTLHAGLNSFTVSRKGEVLNAAAGEYSGINEAVSRLSGGRTTRVQLHSIDSAPHTGCGCFQLIMFKTDSPRPGIAVMDRKYKGRAPDGRSWRDLHYALGGKQAPGMAGAAPNYLRSGKFLAAHDGWESVVWVSPKIAQIMGDDLPAGVSVGPETD